MHPSTIEPRPAETPDSALEAARLRIVVTTIIFNIVAVALLTLAPWSDWRTGLAINAIDNALLIAHAIRHRDRLMVHLLVFGLFVGFTELAADAWLVDSTGTLDYSIGGGPMLWRSPIWMPLAWQIVAVQFGYVGMRLFARFGLAGALLTGLLGAINIPYYEEMALRINWWRYGHCRMLLNTPYYIILGEFLIAAFLAVSAGRLRALRWPRTALLGVAGGASIFAAYAVAIWITA